MIKLHNDIADVQDELCHLLQACVDDGASIGFMAPLSREEALSYWHGVEAELAQGTKFLLNYYEGDTLAGSAQLSYSHKANAIHRGEIQKLLVAPAFRGKGIARALMNALEKEALARAKTLLILDTRKGDVAPILYENMGYTLFGEVPDYALHPYTGAREACVFFYKFLGEG